MTQSEIYLGFSKRQGVQASIRRNGLIGEALRDGDGGVERTVVKRTIWGGSNVRKEPQAQVLKLNTYAECV